MYVNELSSGDNPDDIVMAWGDNECEWFSERFRFLGSFAMAAKGVAPPKPLGLGIATGEDETV
jgi:hypothetical protein